MRRRIALPAALQAMALLLVACSGTGSHLGAGGHPTSGPSSPVPEPTGGKVDVYAHDRPGMLSPAVRGQRSLVYVPDSQSGDVTVIDPATYRVSYRFRVGSVPQHVVPSWDLKTLWVNDNGSGDLVPINPVTGRPGEKVAVADPYNLYFTPDGRFALVMAERNNTIDFRDPHTMRLIRSVKVPCRGPNHADFSADGAFFLTACEFSGTVLKIDTKGQMVTGSIALGGSAMPQDVKLAPDGSVFYVADMAANGVWIIDARTFKQTGFITTGRGAHGLYPSRDSRILYVSNRDEGSISLIDFGTRRVVAKWRIPGGGSPDMGGLSADGKILWLSGRYNGEVYAIATNTGHLIRRIPVGAGPHGLCVWPQPGRYSLGHTGVLR